MVVTIAGCGALGCLLAARLIEAGITVQAYQRAGPHREALARHGITVEWEHGVHAFIAWNASPIGPRSYCRRNS